MKFAANTTVNVGDTVAAIQKLVTSEGGKSFSHMVDDDKGIARIAFRLREHALMFEVSMPRRDLPEFTTYKLGSRTKERTASQAFDRWEQACRARWRALLLAIKAKLVSVDAGVETFEEAFMAALIVPTDSGKSARFGEMAIKAIRDSFVRNGPPQLPSGFEK